MDDVITIIRPYSTRANRDNFYLDLRVAPWPNIRAIGFEAYDFMPVNRYRIPFAQYLKEQCNKLNIVLLDQTVCDWSTYRLPSYRKSRSTPVYTVLLKDNSSAIRFKLLMNRFVEEHFGI